MNKNCPCYSDCVRKTPKHERANVVCPCDQQTRAQDNSVAAAFVSALSATSK